MTSALALETCSRLPSATSPGAYAPRLISPIRPR
eukprot:CAMPEP_0184710914 /NCGR_PEP_ID=MMETSP0314-20130426/1654_1 /TAXON_ID=38298 /ORGANISM="Rhodella maculata, Strain CCMP 736" /LENGTH=33 /DNA_ID= /DNA_START= /DNA_END= /DNA_ORIENTATION=